MALLQLTRQTVPGIFDTEYVFPTGANNGRITSSTRLHQPQTKCIVDRDGDPAVAECDPHKMEPVVPLPIEPGMPLLSREQQRDRLRRLLTLAAITALAENLQGAGDLQVPTFVQAKSECWKEAEPSAGSLAYTLEVTCQIEDSTGQAMNGDSLSGIFISERFDAVTGNIAVQNAPGTWYYGDPNGIQSDGTFVDFLSAGGLPPAFPRNGSAFQSFSTTGLLANGWPLTGQGLIIKGFGADTPLLDNTYGPNNVTINGFGLGRDPKTMRK